LDADEHIHVPCDLPASPLGLWEHLAIKLILNTLSTATMVRMGRVIGNAMVWVSPSNKKLIDRGCRLITQQTGCTYEHACEVLHEAIEEIGRRSQTGEEVPSPVALAIERLGTQGGEKAI
jgi:N-acetylmuramic acid 6-phosphate etherase